MPELKITKCCFCVPVRWSLLVWGYSKLVVSFLVVITFSTLSIRLWSKISVSYDDAVIFFKRIATTIPELLDIVFTILLIISAQKKTLKMLQVYYYYSITMLALYILVILLSAFNIEKFQLLHDIIFHHNWFLDLDYIVILLIGVGNILLQTYLMLLVRSEVHKLYNKRCLKEKFARQKSTTSFKVIGNLEMVTPKIMELKDNPDGNKPSIQEEYVDNYENICTSV